jgi:hypothetical protein
MLFLVSAQNFNNKKILFKILFIAFLITIKNEPTLEEMLITFGCRKKIQVFLKLYNFNI